VREIERLAASGAPTGPLDMTKLSSWTGYIHAQAVDIVNEAFSLAGSTPVYSKSAMQRRWRDVRVAAQHFGGSTANYPVYGGLLEIAQGLWTLRDPEVLDMAAGALGALAAVGILRWIAPRLTRI